MALKNKKSKMTLEKLAQLTQRGFFDLENKFEKRFDGVEKRLDGVEVEIREMRKKSSELFTKLDKFIALYEKQEQEMMIFGAQLRRLEKRVFGLESKTKK
ncbi:MAG: hypothetical protein UU85_C0003G0002 [Candidatus Wolfebacteria bacterium GW2011_GWA2_42_10]|uniref:Uncharacterized protein n=2 Tax=Candidatus Wolfeibacteriota TaxID=1752735 RepID=A0A0G0XKI2_9BACT|nr:MAG: hypothetical protein UU38_C0006G0002 [Candidatus Wolfebacteria bacterium GW2011_GWB1_41_12]KKS25430.1 MAG: hypothetical protein UU85_C0003G0002 [Candidatus Wolfebacteria bacterium GW2011_GWA2_42_10]KKT56608.1 MAG: hypothetical protein UW50_C0001G0176 [Candidatus Wolfebacteria bacterium GW2011_GWA1_44_24]